MAHSINKEPAFVLDVGDPGGRPTATSPRLSLVGAAVLDGNLAKSRPDALARHPGSVRENVAHRQLVLFYLFPDFVRDGVQQFTALFVNLRL